MGADVDETALAPGDSPEGIFNRRLTQINTD
jgi:hypothetical protein